MYTVIYDAKPDFLFVSISGAESFEEAARFWKNLALKVHEEKISKVMVLDQVSGRLSTLEVHQIGELISKLFRGVRIAFVDPKEETYSDNEFGETVIQNRAGRVFLFRSISEAELWLTND